MEHKNYGLFPPQSELILAIGELLVDFVPAHPEMLLCESGEVVKTASGSAGIFACAIAQLSGNSGFLGQLGSDSLSKMVLEVVSAQNVDLSHAIIEKDGQIGLAFVEYVSDGRNYQYYRENSVGSRYSAQKVDTDYIKTAFALHYPGMLLELNETMRGACNHAVSVAREAGVLVSFDPNIRKEMMVSKEARIRLYNALSTADIIAPTLDEARFITGCEEIGDILRTLHAMGPKVIALTRDKDGAVLSANGKVVFAGGIDIPAIDPTGAGDAFAAALVYCVREDYPLEYAAIFCNSMGSLVTMKRGAIGMALPTLEEVKEMAEKKLCTIESFALSELK